ncbi:VanZ family protein [Alkalicoccobacillus murimartini]|uniref:VanZ family protein n=1 Tax=Alkalicoccobacillus murimartini TaxID=171685 RepID=A0ABT9YHF5_9BACI|nr:VanZ family protein [Alkalicoccobacillus murimartini]MDQ0206925.1 VanZ family protein [Alkalicoccobacillus murimartini]
MNRKNGGSLQEKTKLYITAALLVGIIGLIFYSTSQPYSNQDIRPVLNKMPIYWLENTFVNDISFTYGYQVRSIEANGVAGFLEFFIRKASHLSIFAVVGFLATRLLAFYVRVRTAALITFFTVLIYACIDETRQYFSAGRQGLIGDVIIDTVGGTIGIIAMVLWLKRKKRKKRKHSA